MHFHHRIRKTTALVLLATLPALGLAQSAPDGFARSRELLQEGGVAFSYVSLEGRLAKLMRGIRQVFPPDQNQPEVGKIINGIDQGLELLGLKEIASMAASVRESGDHFHHRSFLHLPAGKDTVFQGLLKEPHAFAALDYAPRDTLLLASVDLDPRHLVNTLQARLPAIAGPQAAGAAGLGISYANGYLMQLGLPALDTLLSHFGGEKALFAGLDESALMTVPLDNGAVLTLPLVQLGLLVRNADPAPLDYIKSVARARNIPFTEAEKDRRRYLKLEFPDNSVYPLDVTCVHDGESLLVAGTGAYIERLLAVKAGTEPGFQTGKFFQTYGEDLLLEGNTLFALDGAPIEALMRKADRDLRRLAPESADTANIFINLRSTKLPGHFQTSAHLPDGILTRANSDDAVVQNSGSTVFVAAAVAGVLAAIAIPNFIEAQSRSRVSRAKADMRSLATGLEAYVVDNLEYPPLIGEPTSSSISLQPLTTPVAYLTSLFGDPFAKAGRTYAYYLNPDGRYWILYSPGPDRVYDLDPTTDFPLPNDNVDAHLAPKTYAPTNGTDSGGDLWRVNFEY